MLQLVIQVTHKFSGSNAMKKLVFANYSQEGTYAERNLWN